MNRIASFWPVLLVILGALFAVLALRTRPLPPSLRDEGVLEDPYGGVSVGGGVFVHDDFPRDGLRSGKKRTPLAKRVEYEWPAEFTVGEMQMVTVRLKDFGGTPPGSRPDGREGAEAALPAVGRVKILLEGSGFEFQSKYQQEREVEIGPGVQQVRWGVVALHAPFHALSFRFITGAGDLEVDPSTFQTRVRSLFGVPTWLTYRASSVLAGVANLLAVPGLLALWGRLRRRRHAGPSAA